jgi:hypothetical protein
MEEIVLDVARAGPHWVALAVAAVAAVALFVLGAAMVLRARSHDRRRTAVLRGVFGSEYAHAVASHRGRARAEAALISRLSHCGDVALRDLDAPERTCVEAAWDATATLFVESPIAALHEADVLLGEVIRARGYPVERFDDEAILMSLDHPGLTEYLRAAHGEAVLADEGRTTSTERMRLAMVTYRRVLDALLSPEDAPPVDVGR